MSHSTGLKSGTESYAVRSDALLELGNCFLKANRKAMRLWREFEKLLLEHCGLEDMPSDCSDVYIDLDYYA